MLRSACGLPHEGVLQRYYSVWNVGRQYVHEHLNGVTLVGLGAGHIIRAEKKEVDRVEFDVKEAVGSISGKKKKGGKMMGAHDVICTIWCKDGSVYKPTACVPGKPIEINEALLEHPELLVNDGDDCGWLVMMDPHPQRWEKIKATLEPNSCT